MDERAIFDLVRRAVGVQPAQLVPLTSGSEHRVVLARTAGGAREWVVRMRAPRAGSSLIDEAWALERCLDAGARVPAVRLVAPLEIAGVVVEAMVQDAVPGQAQAAVVDTLSADAPDYVLCQAGEQPAAIHRVAAGGFGRYAPGRGWQWYRWEAYASAGAPAPGPPRAATAPPGLGPRETAAALAAMADAAACRCDRPVLCHRDFGAEHIFVDADLRLTGVSDFGDFEGAPREVDWACFELERGHHDCLALLRAYRQAAGAMPDDWARQLDLTTVRLAWDDLVSEAPGADAEGREWMVGVLRAALARLARRR